MRQVLPILAAVLAGSAAGLLAARLSLPGPPASTVTAPVVAPARGTPAAPPATPSAARAGTDAPATDVQALAREVAALRRELDDLTAHLAERVQAAMRSDFEARPTGARDRAGDTPAAQVERLVAAGFAPDRAQAIVDRFDRAEMERLYARDRAVREGQTNEQYRAALAQIEDPMQGLRNELRAEEYDAFLYASGQRNRVQVGEVLADSPAQAAGLRAGDVLYALAGERIFARDDIARIAAAGSAGEAVTLGVVRDGELVETVVPRGPLGVTAIPRAADPAAGLAVIDERGPPWDDGLHGRRGFGPPGPQ